MNGDRSGASLGIIAGHGHLPRRIAAAYPKAHWLTLNGAEAPAGHCAIPARFERLGEMFAAMKAAGICDVVFAGGMGRPQIDPRQMDSFALSLAQSFAQGDDALLRQVLALFEAQGFRVIGASDLLPEVTLAAGTIWGTGWDAGAMADAERASAILAALSPHDVGQGAVVAGGQVLGIETVQGTEAMLGFVAATPAHLRRAKGVFVKKPKDGQEMRLDKPTIGPDTAAQLERAGLAGIVIDAAGVMVIDAPELKARIEAAGLFLVAN